MSSLSFSVRWSVSLLAALGLLACSGSEGGGSPTQSGELARGTFEYRCLDTSDGACSGAGKPASFPERIAVGGRFAVDYSEGVTEAASSDFLAVSGDGFQAVSEGQVAILGRVSANGDVSDFTHVTLLTTRQIKLSRAQDPAPPLVVGARATYRATPQSSDGSSLAGALAYRWTSSNPAVLAPVGGTTDATAEFEIKSPGTAKLTVQLEGLASSPSGEATITVQP